MLNFLRKLYPDKALNEPQTFERKRCFFYHSKQAKNNGGVRYRYLMVQISYCNKDDDVLKSMLFEKIKQYQNKNCMIKL